MNYTKELSGHLTLETILRWVEEDNETPTIADELRKKKEDELDLVDEQSANDITI